MRLVILSEAWRPRSGRHAQSKDPYPLHTLVGITRHFHPQDLSFRAASEPVKPARASEEPALVRDRTLIRFWVAQRFSAAIKPEKMKSGSANYWHFVDDVSPRKFS